MTKEERLKFEAERISRSLEHKRRLEGLIGQQRFDELNRQGEEVIRGLKDQKIPLQVATGGTKGNRR